MARVKTKKEEGVQPDEREEQSFEEMVEEIVAGMRDEGMPPRSVIHTNFDDYGRESVAISLFLPNVTIGTMTFYHLCFNFTLRRHSSGEGLAVVRSSIGRDPAYPEYDYSDDFPHPHMHTNYAIFCANTGALSKVNRALEANRFSVASAFITGIVGSYNRRDAHHHYEELNICEIVAGCEGYSEYTCGSCERPCCDEHIARCDMCNSYRCVQCVKGKEVGYSKPRDGVEVAEILQLCSGCVDKNIAICACERIRYADEIVTCYHEGCATHVCHACSIMCDACGHLFCLGHRKTGRNSAGLTRYFCPACHGKYSYYQCHTCLSWITSERFDAEKEMCLSCASYTEEIRRRKRIDTLRRREVEKRMNMRPFLVQIEVNL